MLSNQIEKHLNQIVVLDLVNSKEVTGKITEISKEGLVTISKPRMFVPVAVNQNSDKISVVVVDYGHPLYSTNELIIEASHIISIFTPLKNYVDEYIKQTSGIIPASSALSPQLTP